ncbi:hypothetical protein NUU61_004245 [Penicillium alfredii]|uniref:Uncharacterized protein n=1 Tax=Penicillium alfredii TaxID=1506179 RepID=A0A9W9FKS3_9EURO|nr:uncharacterized protein NUU61_004245 [Penicillium alfredii]KAJ5102023.1 hypothetical protein NUU61_004245 [Penicillium alfredii]
MMWYTRSEDSESESGSATPTPFHQNPQVKRCLQEKQEHRREVLSRVLSLQIPTIPDDFIRRLDQVQVSCGLVMTMLYLKDKQTDDAEAEAKQALATAENLEEERLIARCYYWMGRIEFTRGNMATAYSHFGAAQPCILDDDYREGRDLDFYKTLCSQGERKVFQPPMDHSNIRATTLRKPTKSAMFSMTIGSRKRKRDGRNRDMEFC